MYLNIDFKTLNRFDDLHRSFLFSDIGNGYMYGDSDGCSTITFIIQLLLGTGDGSTLHVGNGCGECPDDFIYRVGLMCT